MTNETRERIKYYQNLLPGMKEKVVAAALMMVIALSVTVTASYAWITLSTAPEVTSIDTTIAANGSLEIALANGTGSAPGKSAVGDSTGAGTAVNIANHTWGNLVNLSDPSYGLSKITLRPAALNGTSGLLTNPLYGVGYGEDGRVDAMVTDDDFAYVYFDTDSEKFLVDMDDNHLGVRAISTVKYENLEGDNTLAELLKETNQNHTVAKNNYASMTNEAQSPGKEYIASLQGLIQVYAQNILDKKSNNTLDISAYVEDLYDMMQYFNNKVMEPVGASYVQMANMLELMKGSGAADAGYDVAGLVAASRAGTLPDYIKNNIPSLPAYANDYNTLHTYLKTGEKEDFSDLTASQQKQSLAYWAYYVANGGTVYWSDLNSHINWICEISTAELDGYNMSKLMSKATEILGKSDHEAVIKGGAIYRMEKRIGQKMSPEISVTVDASSIMSMIGKKTLNAVLTTSATDPYEIPTDRDLIKSFNTGSFKGDTATAEDTYAMALDFWLRTNAGSDGEPKTEEITETLEDGTTKTTVVTTSPEQAYLTLEGAIRMGTKETHATIKDANGEEQPAYTASATVSGQKITMEVFKRYENYYFVDESGKEFELESYLLENYGIVPEIGYTPKMTQTEVVIGYEGANRVWNEEQMASYEGFGTNTTQGGGSCYVFYANTPADQLRFLELLGSMRVAFVNAQGRLIGSAVLDTVNHFAENGKVTVPLVLDKNQAVELGYDLDGNAIYGLMPLTKDAATRVTALVYLDGTKLTNDMVLASGDIQGTLNLQFGSSTALTRTTTTTESNAEGETTTDTTVDYVSGSDNIAIEDDKVMNQFVEVSARVDNSEFEYDPNSPVTTQLTVTVGGIEPKNVSARFMRAISSTQGVLQDSIVLSGSGSNWTTTCTFEKPGNYVLRSVWVDGVEYSLDVPVEIKIIGSSVSSLTCEAITDGSGYAAVMTASNSFNTKMTLGFTSSKAVPSRVNGIFMDEDGRQVNVPFKLENNTWAGTARFTTSGTFTMKYVEIDGDTYELNEALQPTLEILLGLKVRTWITATEETLNRLQKLLPTAMATNFVIDGEVPLIVSAEIYDNAGNEINGLSNVKLYYGRSGSAILSNGLDCDLNWNVTEGRYVGAFNVMRAGTYKFSKVTVGDNTIENYTTAPNIQAMPPEDAYYFNNYTEEYQYAPKVDGAMTIGIAYSNAASKVTATITNGTTTTEVVDGIMGTEAEDQGDKSVNLWRFPVPSINGSQEGDWKLEGITMYGVYYDGKYYADKEEGGNGVYIDLTQENIHSKIVNYLRVTLSGTNQEFTNYFMEENPVNDLKVTIADYEGKAIEGITINNLKVVYSLDADSVSMDAFGYEADKEQLQSITVSAEGTLLDGSATEYQIAPLKLQTAGLYKKCSISFSVGNSSFTAGGDGTTVSYVIDGKASSACPQYRVNWNAPTLKITGTDPKGSTASNPTGGSSFKINVHTGGGTNLHEISVRNYYEDYYANTYLKVNSLIGMATGYTVPEVTLQLSNAGTKINSTNTATFHYSFYSNTLTNSVTFTASNSSKAMKVGAVDGSSRRLLGNVVTKTIDMLYGGITYKVQLSHPIELRQDNKGITEVSYAIPELYKDMFTAPADMVSYDGRPIQAELPLMSKTKTVAVQQGEGTTTYVYTEVKQPITWTEGSGCDEKTYNGYKVTTIRTPKVTGSFADVERTYVTSKWSIASTTITESPKTTTTTYNAGTARSISTNKNVITAVVTYTDGASSAPYTSTETLDDASTTTVVWQDSSGATISEPAGASNNGNATERTWESDN